MNILVVAVLIAIGLGPGVPAISIPEPFKDGSISEPFTDGSVEHATTPSVKPSRSREPVTRDPRFYAKDAHLYRSVWFKGRHRKMVPFGCTSAPYYDPDMRCADGRGFHHGIDIAMPCGTLLSAGLSGVVVDPTESGSLGPAYGPHAFRIRNEAVGVDIIIGHTRRVFVDPGDRVTKHQSIGRASDAGAPDGCHLHFEVRPIAGSYTAATDPLSLLQLVRAD